VKLLLDTCASLWIASGDPALSSAGRRLFLSAEEVWLSAASCQEIEVKHSRGKLALPESRRVTFPASEMLTLLRRYRGTRPMRSTFPPYRYFTKTPSTRPLRPPPDQSIDLQGAGHPHARSAYSGLSGAVGVVTACWRRGSVSMRAVATRSSTRRVDSRVPANAKTASSSVSRRQMRLPCTATRRAAALPLSAS